MANPSPVSLDAYYPLTGVDMTQADWESIAAMWIGDGVVQPLPLLAPQNTSSPISGGYTNNMLVVSQHSTGMTLEIDIAEGAVVIQGTLGVSGSVKHFTAGANTTMATRIDWVVASLIPGTPIIELNYYQGTSSNTPPTSQFQQTGTQWDVLLAEIHLPQNATAITNTQIFNMPGVASSTAQTLSSVPSFPYGGVAGTLMAAKIVLSTELPTAFPVGGIILTVDTSSVYMNTGTFASPVWTNLTAALSSANPTTLTFGESPSPGSALTASRSDHAHGMPAQPPLASTLSVAGAQATSGGTLYVSPVAGVSATEADVVCPLPYAGTIRNLYVILQGNLSAGQDSTITARYGTTAGGMANAGSPSTMQVVIQGAENAGTVGSDTSNTITVAAGGLLSFSVGAATAPPVGIVVEYDHS